MSVGEGMITVFTTLKPLSTLDEAAEALIRTTQQEFPVVDDTGRLAGFLTRSALFKALAQGDRTAPVEQFMDKDVPTVREGARLEAALEAMRAGSARAVGVVDGGGKLIAYVTPENLGELMVVRRPDR
jgi:CBS domain-containing protein